MSDLPPRTLIADDQPDVIEALRLLLKADGHRIDTANSPRAVLEAVSRNEYDLLLLDLNYTRDTTSGAEGIDLIGRIRQIDEVLPIIPMTAWGSVDLAVEAMRTGGCTFIQKPWDNDRLMTLIHTEMSKARAERHARQTVPHFRASDLAETEGLQRRLVPESFPAFEGVELTAEWRAARTVSGDYFDVFSYGSSRGLVCIADVEGKGLPAALVMSSLQASVKSAAASAIRPSDLCRRANVMTARVFGPEKLITFFAASFNAASQQIWYANAGHVPALLVHASGEIDRLVDGGPILGVLEDAAYTESMVPFVPGDRVLFVTDGILDARSPAGEPFGQDRLVQLARETRALPVEAMKEAILERVTSFAAGHFEDDLTLVILAAR